mgnify:CR=1 FL=1
MAKTSQAKIDANARYNKKVYEQIIFAVRRDSELNGDAIRTHAAEQGESVRGFLLRAVAETVERDRAKR